MTANERELAEALASELEAEIRPARVRKPLTRGRIFVISLASLLSLTFIWFAITSTIAGSTQVKTQDIGFEVVSDQQVDFRFTVTTPAELSNPATCAVQALNQQFAIVGYKEVALPAKTKAGEVISVTVNTTELAVSGLVDYCWLD
jgi:hypothetical protein